MVHRALWRLGLAIAVSTCCATASAQFTTIINVPPDPIPPSAGAGT